MTHQGFIICLIFKKAYYSYYYSYYTMLLYDYIYAEKKEMKERWKSDVLTYNKELNHMQQYICQLTYKHAMCSKTETLLTPQNSLILLF